MKAIKIYSKPTYNGNIYFLGYFNGFMNDGTILTARNQNEAVEFEDYDEFEDMLVKLNAYDFTIAKPAFAA